MTGRRPPTGGLDALVLAALLASTACSRGPDARHVDAEVRAFVTDYVAAIGDRDTSRLRQMFAPAPRLAWYEDGALRYASPDDVLAGLAAFPADAELTTAFEDLRITPLGADHAVASARHTTRVASTTAPSFEFAGAITFVVEREPQNGGRRWRIVTGHSSAPRDR